MQSIFRNTRNFNALSFSNCDSCSSDVTFWHRLSRFAFHSLEFRAMNHSPQTKPCPKRQKQTLSELPTKYVITDRREVLTKNKNWMSILRMQAGIDLGLIKLFNSKSQADLVVEALNRKGIQVQSLSLAEASELSLVRSACLAFNQYSCRTSWYSNSLEIPNPYTDQVQCSMI